MDNCNPEREGVAQGDRTRGGTFHGEMGRCRVRAALLRHAVVCPNGAERTKERIVQSKRARAGSLAMVN